MAGAVRDCYTTASYSRTVQTVAMIVSKREVKKPREERNPAVDSGFVTAPDDTFPPPTPFAPCLAYNSRLLLLSEVERRVAFCRFRELAAGSCIVSTFSYAAW